MNQIWLNEGHTGWPTFMHWMVSIRFTHLNSKVVFNHAVESM